MNLATVRNSAIAIGVGLMLIGSALGAQAAEQRYLVIFKSEVLPSDAADRIARAGGKARKSLSAIGTVVASGDAVFADLIGRDPGVLAVGVEGLRRLPPSAVTPVSDGEVGLPNGAPTPADSLFFYQWDMRRIGAPAVWSRMPLAGGTPVVALLDSGVADNHPDLAGKIALMVATSYCNTPGGPSNTASYPRYSTYVDLVAHPDWTPADGCASLGGSTYDFHGTHVAGTIAARFGGGRVVGVAPDAAIAAYKVFDVIRQPNPETGLPEFGVGAFDGPIFAAIINAANAGYPVISMSLGGYVDRSTADGNAAWHAWSRVAKYADKKGALIVASAGNDAVSLNGPLAHIPSDLPGVMSTPATGWSELQVDPATGFFAPAPGSHDVLAFYSNYGAPVDVSAPGGDCGPVADPACLVQYLILSTYINSAGGLGYAFAAGTSMATPHVSAVAAMVRALHPDWKTSRVRTHLQSTAENVRPRQSFGHGILDADAAVR